MGINGDSDSTREKPLDKKHEKIRTFLRAWDKKMPNWLRGIKGSWRLFSAFGIIGIALAVLFAVLGHIIWTLIFAGLVTLFFILSNLWLQAHVVAPILGLSDTACRIAAGSYGTLAEKHREDEIGVLTDAINDMSEKICAANQTQTEFISSVSHELRTPLTAITGWSETMLYD
ncbi:MAG: HAMP domain-containing histidine kinase, partial [Clostridia bacterium]|nr:HAMP domain-containing histidine kinase [Clostridia bacterium]